MGGELQVLLSPWLILGACPLIVLVLRETLLVPLLLYGSETIWIEKERSRIRAMQMDWTTSEVCWVLGELIEYRIHGLENYA